MILLVLKANINTITLQLLLHCNLAFCWNLRIKYIRMKSLYIYRRGDVNYILLRDMKKFQNFVLEYCDNCQKWNALIREDQRWERNCLIMRIFIVLDEASSYCFLVDQCHIVHVRRNQCVVCRFLIPPPLIYFT